MKTRPTSRAVNAHQPLSHNVATVVKTTRAQKQTAMNLVVILHQKHVAILSVVAVKPSHQKLAAMLNADSGKARLSRAVKVIAQKRPMPANARQTGGVSVMQIMAHAVRVMARSSIRVHAMAKAMPKTMARETAIKSVVVLRRRTVISTHAARVMENADHAQI